MQYSNKDIWSVSYPILLALLAQNVVNVTDVMNLVTFVLKEKTEVFINEVSDMNDDDTFNVTDAMGVVEIVLE